jgi:hypothetical protein
MSGGLAIPWRRLVVWRARTLAGRRGGLQFGVLGPLKVTQAGRPLDLGRPKPRAVLALLLLEAQTGSCRSTASSTACGVTNRPARSTASLQAYVSNLSGGCSNW